MPSFDELETFDDVTSSSITTKTTSQPLPQKSFFGYNIKEVTANGKTRGTVQVFGNEGVEKNVQYNELTKPSNITNLLSNITTIVKSPASTNTRPATPKVTTAKSVSTSTTAIPAVNDGSNKQKSAETTTVNPVERPRHIIIEDVQPFTREFAYDQPIASDFATPEFILYDFLGQLQSFPYIPTENFDENRYSTFDELVSQNTYVYKKR